MSLKQALSLCSVAIILLIAGCAPSNISRSDEVVTQNLIGSVDKTRLTSNIFTQPDPDGNKPLPQYSMDGYELVVENERLALYLREKSASIRVIDKTGKYVWGALENDKPDNLNSTWASFASSVVSIEYMDKTGSVKQIGAGHRDAECNFEFIDDGFICTAYFGEEIGITLSVIVRLDDDHLTFSLTDDSIKEDGEFYVSKVYFSPFFGSTVGDDSDGYIFIPDGCGALIRYQKPMNYLKGYSERVYGLDAAIDSMSRLNDLNSNRPIEFLKETDSVVVPVYGLTHGVKQHALFGRIKNGAEYAYINASPAGMITDYNWVSASFVYRQVYEQPTAKSGGGIPVVQKTPNAVNPRLELYFLNGEDADYSGMARLYANILAKEGSLPSDQVKSSYQVALDFIVSDVEKGFMQNHSKTLSTSNAVEKAVRTLHDAGLAGILVSLKGWQKGGLNGYNKSTIYDSTAWGRFNNLSSLKNMIVQKGGSLKVYIDPLRAREPQVNLRRDVGITLSQNPIKMDNNANKFLGTVYYLKSNIGMKNLETQLSVLFKHGLTATIDGGNLLYGEYLTDKFVSRTQVLELFEQVYGRIAKANGLLTIYKPNEYLFKYTGVYRDIAMSNSQFIYETDSVPFLQMVLSGYMTMVATYSNESFYSRTDLLKCIEYNVVPSFLLTEVDNRELKNTTLQDFSSTCFESWQSTITQFVKEVNSILGLVRGRKMLEHRAVSFGVYEVIYENGIIYVNYNDKPYAVSNQYSVPEESALFVPNTV